MSDHVFTAVIIGLGGMFAWGLSDFLAKKTLDDGIDEFRFVFWLQLLGLLPLAIFLAGRGDFPAIPLVTVAYLVLFGLFEAASDILMYRAFAKGPVSLISPVFASYSGVVVVLSMVLFGEVIPLSTLLGLAVILTGIVLVNIDVRGIRTILKRRPTLAVKGMPEAFSAVAIYSTFLVLYDQVVSGEDWVLYLFLIRGIEIVALIAYALFTRRTFRLVKGERKLLHLVGLSALLDAAAYSFVSFGFSVSTHTSIVAVLSASFSLPTMLLAWRFLKEKVAVQQAIAGFAIVAGIAIVILT